MSWIDDLSTVRAWQDQGSSVPFQSKANAVGCLKAVDNGDWGRTDLYIRTIKVADLASMPGAYDGQLAFVEAYATRGDDGGGFFVWSTSSHTADGYLIIAATGGYWLRIYSGTVNVKWFGAKGDGSTDDTSAIQSAITQAYGSQLFLPTGTYILTDRLTITSGITIQGEGWSSILKHTTAGGVTRFAPILLENASTPISGVVIRDLAIDGSNRGQLDAGLIQLNNCVGFLVDHVRAFAGGTPAEASPQGVNGITVSAGSLGGIASQGTIRNCLIENCTKAGINWTTEAINGQIVGNIVRNCTGNGSTPGIQVNGGFHAKVTENSVYGCEGPGIYLATSGGAGTERSPKFGIIANNHSYANGGAGIDWGNGTSVTHGRVLITGNHCYGSTGDSGIKIANDTNAIVSHNYAYNNYYSGFTFSGTTTDLLIADNVAENNNQAGTSTGAGYYVAGTSHSGLTLRNNHAVDTQGSPTHKYGLIIDGSPTFTRLNISGMHCSGSANTPQVSISATATLNEFDITLTFENTTTDASPQNTGYWVVPDSSAVAYRFKALAKKSDGTDRALYEKSMLAYRSGGGTTIQGSAVTHVEVESDAAWDAAVYVTGNYVSARITGKAATTINWLIDVAARSL